MNQPQANRNFCNEKNTALKLSIVECYNKRKGYYEQSDQKANSYSMIQCTNGQQNFFSTYHRNEKMPQSPLPQVGRGVK